MERDSFDVFKSNICHLIKDKGELTFIENVILSDEPQKLFDKHWYPESLYLVAMVDYLSRKNDIPLYGGYNKLRACKLEKIVYPSSIMMMYLLSKNEKILQDSYHNAIPEFKRFNIVESDIENVV